MMNDDQAGRAALAILRQLTEWEFGVPPRSSAETVDALVECGSVAVPTLIGCLNEPCAEVSLDPFRASDGPETYVIRALGRIGDRRAVPALLRVLCEGKHNLRPEAADALRLIRDPAALPALCAQARRRFPEPTLYAVARALAALGGPGEAAELGELLPWLSGSPDDRYRCTPHSELAQVACEEVAARLGEIGPPGAVSLLLRCAGSAAIEGLARVGPSAVPELIRALDPDWEIDAYVPLGALIELGSAAKPDLEAALSHSSPVMQSRCAAALILIGQPVRNGPSLLAAGLRDPAATLFIIRAIQHLAEFSPTSDLRFTLDGLKSLKRSWSASAELRTAAREAFNVVERATAALRSLPIACVPADIQATKLPISISGQSGGDESRNVDLAALVADRSDTCEIGSCSIAVGVEVRLVLEKGRG
jgi:HEAT repeat protein